MDQRALQQQSQKLHLSPQLRQYLKFLYLPQMELKEALQQELAENPILEEIQESPQTDSDSPEQQEEKREDSSPEDASDDFAPEIDFSRKSKQDCSPPSVKKLRSRNPFRLPNI
jgi:DNA-directed RNA polymerase specialized sigma54-like protein